MMGQTYRSLTVNGSLNTVRLEDPNSNVILDDMCENSLDILNMPRNNALCCPSKMHHLNNFNLDLSE